MIAPNTISKVEIKGSNLRAPGDLRRIWQQSDFSGNGLTMPTQLDGVKCDGEWQEAGSVRLLHQPFAGEYSDASRMRSRGRLRCG